MRRARLTQLAQELDPVEVFAAALANRAYVESHPHAVAQLTGFHAKVPEFRRRMRLPPWIVDRHVPGTDVFVETDHFLGYVNTERHNLIDAIEAARDANDPGSLPDPDVYVRHQARAAAIGDRPGQLKAAMLRRRTYPGTGRVPWRAFAEVEWNLRVKAWWLLRWVALSRPLRARSNRGSI